MTHFSSELAITARILQRISMIPAELIALGFGINTFAMIAPTKKIFWSGFATLADMPLDWSGKKVRLKKGSLRSRDDGGGDGGGNGGG